MTMIKIEILLKLHVMYIVLALFILVLPTSIAHQLPMLNLMENWKATKINICIIQVQVLKPLTIINAFNHWKNECEVTIEISPLERGCSFIVRIIKKKKKTLIFSTLPSWCNPIIFKWIFKIKYITNGNIQKYKACHIVWEFTCL